MFLVLNQNKIVAVLLKDYNGNEVDEVFASMVCVLSEHYAQQEASNYWNKDRLRNFITFDYFKL